MIRLATAKDLPHIMKVIAEGKAYLASQNVDQWQLDYPNIHVISSDIDNEKSYVFEDEFGRIIATFMLTNEDEENYHTIRDGQWLTVSSPKNPSYIAIHRMATSQSMKKPGTASKMLEFAAQKGREKNCESIRIDTHPDNLAMKKLLEKSGFKLCGTISLPPSRKEASLREGFERLL